MPKNIFISYAREDIEVAERLYADLKERQLNPWMDSKDLKPGDPWKVRIREVIADCSYSLLLMSSRSTKKKGYIQKEIRQALEVFEEFPENRTFLIPIRIDECSPSFALLHDINWVDIFPSYAEGLQKILKVIQPKQIPSNHMKSIVGIPAIPEEIYSGLKKAAWQDKFLVWNVGFGDRVKEGEEVARYQVKSFNANHFARKKIVTKATIEAPISGKISRINPIEFSKWNWDKLERTLDGNFYFPRDEKNEHEHLKKENILFFIETSDEVYVPGAYKAYENIVDYGYFAQAQDDAKIFLNFIGFFKGSSFRKNDFPTPFLEGLANSELRHDKL